jgi:predicted nucleic-acid-binding protein
MIAFDTNLLVRAVVDDNPSQVAIVRRLIMRNSVFISRTVLLETEWVLRAVYMKSRDEILEFFRALLVVITPKSKIQLKSGMHLTGMDKDLILPMPCILLFAAPP